MDRLQRFIRSYHFPFVVAGIVLAIPNIDLEIAKRAYIPLNWFGNFVQDYGELPGWSLIFSGSLIILRKMHEISKLWFLSALITVIITGFGHLSILGLWPGVIYLIVWMQIVMFLDDKFSTQENPLYMTFGKVSVILGIIYPAILTGLIKLLWGRIRYRDLTSDSEFSLWFVINGITDNYSFPSGHTAMAMMVLLLLILIKHLNLKGRTLIIMKSVIYTYPIIVAYGRMVKGAHYLSDVLFAIWLGIMCYNVISTRVLEKSD